MKGVCKLSTVFPRDLTSKSEYPVFAFLKGTDGSFRAEIEGATDQENNEFNARISANSKMFSKEALDLAVNTPSRVDSISVSYASASGESVTPSDSAWATRPMPANCYAYNENDDSNQKILESMTQTLNDYYAGKVTIDDVTTSFKNAFQAMKNFMVGNHYTSDNDVENNQQILLDTYNVFRQYAVSTASTACQNEGKQIAQQYGTEGNPDWVYYNSDYYYESEDVKSAVKDCAAGLAKELGLGNVDLPTEFNDPLRAELYNSFNTNWNWGSTKNVGVSTMLDTDKIPPKDFKFFFKEQKYTQKQISNTASDINSDAGVLLVSSGNWQQEVEVPFSYDFDKNGHFNVASLIQALSSSCQNSDEINSYLNNFDVYLKAYAYSTGSYGYFKQ